MSSSNKQKELKDLIEKRRKERLEKAKQREKKILEIKMQKLKEKELPLIRSKSYSNLAQKSKRISTSAPLVRQTKTSQKRIDIINLNIPEYQELTKEFEEKQSKELPKIPQKHEEVKDNNLVINKPRKQWSSPKPLPINFTSSHNNNNSKKSIVNAEIIKPKIEKKSNGLRRSISASQLNKLNDTNKSIRRSQSSDRLFDETSTNNMSIRECKTPKPIDLQKRLIKWLKIHGKEIGAYKNLHLFGTRKSIVPKPTKPQNENKENEITPRQNPNLNETFEKPTITEANNEKEIAEAILNDLHSLIVDNYPKDQCSEWLTSIKKRYDFIKDLSLFWECKALLETDNEDFQSAIECYKRAVETGAEQINVENRLCNLFDKMCSLNIDPKSIQEKALKNSLVENREEFASTIVKFAVCQSRKQKSTDEEENYFVTPVRRSSRLWSKTPNSATPFKNIQYVSSLNKLDEKIRRSMKFTPNKALDIQ